LPPSLGPYGAGMSTTITPSTEKELVDRAAAVGPDLAAAAAKHDVDGTFVEEGLQALREAGLLALAVPTELGGLGATPRQVAMVQRELARHCGSTALATSMHQHVTAFTAWRYRRDMPGAEATLRRVAAEGILLVSTGGGDFTRPKGEARKVDGGYRVSGRKQFASQSSYGDVLSTMFVFEDPEQGQRVLNMAVPVRAEGVSVLDNWDTLGMRGTASNDVVLEDVLVPEDKVLANRPYGVVDPALQVIVSIAMPIIAAVYLGVAEAAYEAALEVAKRKADDPLVQRQVGLMAHRLRVASWALDGAVAEIGDDPAPSMEAFHTANTAKREIALAGVEVCDLAMDVGGGPAFFRGSVIERCYRDIRAAKFHPLNPELTLVHGGRIALGVPAEEV
jgi:alkylation response protein AidB-like acyl-CoA dehydrogenase